MQKGELIFKGKNVYCGYIEDYKGYKKLENNKLLFTGDIAYRNKNNHIMIAGRKKRFVKIDGHRVDLDYLESLIENFNITCLCTGADDNLKIYYKNKNDNKKILKILKTFKKINLRYVKLDRIMEIPLLPSGKKNYLFKNA